MNSLRDEIENLKAERRMILSVLSKLLPSVVAHHIPDPSGIDYDWGWVVYMQLPTGKQVSFHVGDSARAAWFSHLTVANISPWDGHNDDTKWERVVEYIRRDENENG